MVTLAVFLRQTEYYIPGLLFSEALMYISLETKSLPMPVFRIMASIGLSGQRAGEVLMCATHSLC